MPEDATDPYVVAALSNIGWSEVEEDDEGEIVVFNNPRRPDSPIVWQKSGTGQDLASQLNHAGVTPAEWEAAVLQAMPPTPYGSPYDL